MQVASWVSDKVQGVPNSRNSLYKTCGMILTKRIPDLDPVVEDIVSAGLRNKVRGGHGGLAITLVDVLHPLQGGRVESGWNW